jgi:hypothetical protein
MLLACITLLLSLGTPSVPTVVTLDITTLGAKGDGQTMNTPSFSKPSTPSPQKAAASSWSPQVIS